MTALRLTARPLPALCALLLLCAALAGCDKTSGDFRLHNNQIVGHSMSFAVPDGYTDMQEHPEFERTGIARQFRRAGAVMVLGPMEGLLYNAVSVMPLGPAERIDMTEALCTQFANQTRAQYQNQTRQLGIEGSVRVKEVHYPGEIPDTDCEFSLELGRGDHFVMAVFFEHQDTKFLVTCETNTFEQAMKLCDDLFYSWRT